MNKLISSAVSYVKQVPATLRSPEVRSQLQAVLQSVEMLQLIATLRGSLQTVPTSSSQDSPELALNPPGSQPGANPNPAARSEPPLTGRARHRRRNAKMP